ncbi:SDR family NAD(P)-dependent oxidoreductase [Gordonia humi]|uniref:NAD(P)-dependent dehydrogenase (Short-subunit alcohol dehydrogenase family) n=1 Tax=Gordonia humi TaxID=686429 RepID=A0A840EP55_9ACTN|nr:NAD(P)-dependent dehydrogenase (short-subunit alcohol dehydrogenase family) [Gordonia humi]
MTERRAAVVTGASRGIGAAVADRFAREGWDLTISARGADVLEDRAEALRAHGGRVLAVAADMADEDAVAALAARHLDEYDRTDALILNAGMGSMGSFEEFPARRLDKLYQVNLRAPFQLTQLLLASLKKNVTADVGAKVVAISSITGVYPEPNLFAYGSTKAALISMCETFNLEQSVHGVSATSICPGYVDTDMSEWTKGDGAIPAEEMISGSDIAELAYTVTQLSRWAVLPQAILTRPGENMHRA